jgi:hypothetical protein
MWRQNYTALEASTLAPLAAGNTLECGGPAPLCNLGYLATGSDE